MESCIPWKNVEVKENEDGVLSLRLDKEKVIKHLVRAFSVGAKDNRDTGEKCRMELEERNSEQLPKTVHAHY